MSELKVTIDPKEVGMSAERLARIDSHFKDYVDDGRLPGYHVAVARYGQIVHSSTYGMRDSEAKLPIEQDTMYRIYSMTKPITSIALMMLVEEGKIQLTDEVSNYIPSFGNIRVFAGGSSMKPITAPSRAPMRVWHLLTHTAGLTYGFNYFDATDAIYRAHEAEFAKENPNPTLEEVCDRYAAMPLVFEPGTSWNYSVATDVVGRLVEVVSGMRLGDFFQKRILGPLGMNDTSFYVDPAKQSRLAALYAFDPSPAKKVRFGAIENQVVTPRSFDSGGGGLVSTAADYWKFLQMLENGGELNGVRIVSPTTIDLMTLNHIPGNKDISDWGRPMGEEVFYDGLGFGLGFAVVIDQAKTKVACSNGTYSWGGMASTAFWIDPVEEITAMFFTQLMPSTTHPIRPFLRSLVYQSITE